MIEFFKNLSATDWIGLTGGISGLFSSGAYFYDKLGSGPKIVSEVTSATVYEIAPSQSDSRFRYDFTIEVDIGNEGGRLTSVLKPKLQIKEISANYELSFPDKNNNQPLQLYTKPSVALEAGFADSYTLRCSYCCEVKIDMTSLSGVLELKQIKGKRIQHDFIFKKWESK